MCDCIKTTEQKLQEMFFPDAESISFDNVEMLSQKLYSTVSVKLPEKKKPLKRLILHSHCPMCGEKYPETKGEH